MIAIRSTSSADLRILLPQVRSLMNRNRGLGYIPVSARGNNGFTKIIQRGNCIVALCDDHLLGYVAWGRMVPLNVHRVYQIVVRPEIRRMGLGTALLARMIATVRSDVVAYVREDLQECGFWERHGFEELLWYNHPTSGNVIRIYHRPWS